MASSPTVRQHHHVFAKRRIPLSSRLKVKCFSEGGEKLVNGGR
jgi:hypothetical protein